MVLLAIIVSSCDIAAYITVKNQSGGNITFSYEKVDAEKESNLVKVELPNENIIGNEMNIFFGFGNLWDDLRIKEFSDNINYLKISTQSDTLKIVEKKELEAFLKSRRKGLFKIELWSR